MGLGVRMSPQMCALPPGRRNLISDVPGVLVGHTDVIAEGVRTGVTAVLPGEDPFGRKFPAACHIANGFGKSIGLVQIAELGTLETPILLTNTLSVPVCSEALVSGALAEHEEIGLTTGTVNPVVLECNDGAINHIRRRMVTEEDARAALSSASSDFAEGDVGAGRGMTCFGLKGGIGSSSRVIPLGSSRYTLGVLTLTNFGAMENLQVSGMALGAELLRAEERGETPLGLLANDAHRRVAPRGETGSIVTVVATDAPVDARQLGRLARRVTVGVVRTGGYIGDGSGEIVVAFSTANRVAHWPDRGIDRIERLHESEMDGMFRAVASATEEAIVSSLIHAHTVRGLWGTVHSLADAAAYNGLRLPVGECSR